MQREVSKAAIGACRKNNLSEFFTKIREISKYKDQHGVPSDHQEQLKELCARIKNSSALNGEEICQIAMLTAYLFQNQEESNKLIAKAQQKDPNNEFIFREAVFLAHYDNKEDEAKVMFDQRKASLKDSAIRDDLEKFFSIKAECNRVRDDIIPLLGEEKWAEADDKIVAAIRATGGLNSYNLELYRMRMDSLGGQPNNQQNLGEFYMNLATQNPGSNGYYQYAGSAFLQANLYDQAIVAYTNYFKYECDDIEELDKFLSIADKNTQITTLEGLLSNKIASSDQKQDIIKKLAAVGGNPSPAANESDEEEQQKEEHNNRNILAENSTNIAVNIDAAAVHEQVQKLSNESTGHLLVQDGIISEKFHDPNAAFNEENADDYNMVDQEQNSNQKGSSQKQIAAPNFIFKERDDSEKEEFKQLEQQNDPNTQAQNTSCTVAGAAVHEEDSPESQHGQTKHIEQQNDVMVTENVSKRSLDQNDEKNQQRDQQQIMGQQNEQNSNQIQSSQGQFAAPNPIMHSSEQTEIKQMEQGKVQEDNQQSLEFKTDCFKANLQEDPNSNNKKKQEPTIVPVKEGSCCCIIF